MNQEIHSKCDTLAMLAKVEGTIETEISVTDGVLFCWA